MDLQLKKQAILITGSSRGIGRTISEEFLKEKAKVFITGRNYKTLESTFLDFKKTYGAKKIFKFNGDLNQPKVLKKLNQYIVDKNKGLDHIICNIGNGNSFSSFKENGIEFQRMLDKNLLNAVGIVNNLHPLLKKSIDKVSCSPSITFISSICGTEFLGCPVAYSTAKSALVSYAKNISFSMGRIGIRVNVISPGNIYFPGSVWEKKQQESPLKVDEMLKEEVPLQCFGDREDVANVATFLSSIKAKFVSGANWIVDGGQTRSWR